MEKINVAELLKNCPQGIELDCTMFDNANFIGIENYDKPICIRIGNGDLYFHLTKFGTWNFDKNAKCIIFPKGKTTWKGFHRPFKKGDIIYTKDKLGTEFVSIFQIEYERDICTYWDMNISTNKLIGSLHDGNAFKIFIEKDKVKEQRLATEEEKERLFKAIKDNGYRWNTETKTLEKLVKPKFNIEKNKWYVCTKDLLDRYATKAFYKGDTYLSTQDGSLIPSNSNVPFKVACASEYFRDWTINDAKDGDIVFYNDTISIFKEWGDATLFRAYVCTYLYCEGFIDKNVPLFGKSIRKEIRLATEEEKQKLFNAIKDNGYKWNADEKKLEKLIELKFKVGDKVRNKNNHNVVFTITSIEEDSYVCGAKTAFWFDDQDNYELVPNKFDINTLKPFDKVLVRNTNKDYWKISMFGYISKGDTQYFMCIANSGFYQCIPYEGNEHLLGTTDDCDEYYKIWKN